MSPDPGSTARRELNTKNSGVAKRRAGQWVIRSVKEICRILLLKMEREERCAALEKKSMLWRIANVMGLNSLYQQHEGVSAHFIVSKTENTTMQLKYLDVVT